MAHPFTVDFVHHYELLTGRTGNSPNGVRGALNHDDGRLAESIEELVCMFLLVEKHRRLSKSRFIAQAHPRFLDALVDYEKRWRHTLVQLRDWEAEQRGEEPPSSILGRLLEGSTAESKDDKPEDAEGHPERYNWNFDPDRDFAASEIGFAEEMLRLESQNGYEEQYCAACSLAAGALKWIREAVGLDLEQIQRRWREFPVTIVPEGVSNKHGIEDPYSLFGYLTQIRLAYIAGADLAAIAMCRAVTEILVRVHYNHDDKTDLMTLIRSTEKNRDGRVLRDRNIAAKVREANDILHVNKDDIKHKDRLGALIRDWVQALQDMIAEGRRHSGKY